MIIQCSADPKFWGKYSKKRNVSFQGMHTMNPPPQDPPLNLGQVKTYVFLFTAQLGLSYPLNHECHFNKKSHQHQHM